MASTVPRAMARLGQTRPTEAWLRPAVVAQVTALLTLLTSVLSVALTFAWQSKWRRIEKPPFISDAHYDDIQSPIFAVTATLTSLCGTCTTIVTYFISKERERRQSVYAQLGGASAPKRYCLPIRVRGPAQRYVAIFGLCMGLFGSTLLSVAAAVSSKIRFHFVAISLSFSATILWAFAVSVTLDAQSPAFEEARMETLNTWVMQLCVILLGATVIALISVHASNLFASAALEYMVVALLAFFLLLLSFRLRGSRVLATFSESAARAPPGDGDEDSDESIELQVLVR